MIELGTTLPAYRIKRAFLILGLRVYRVGGGTAAALGKFVRVHRGGIPTVPECESCLLQLTTCIWLLALWLHSTRSPC